MTARVLVVDDVRPNVELLKARLEGRYFLVDTAQDGPSGIAAAKRLVPDVILLDVMMPGMNGFDVCAHLKADPATAHVPIVLVTALAEREYRLKGLEAGADDFLTKPVDDATLIARVRSLARLKTMMDEWRTRLGTIQELGIDVPASEHHVPDQPGKVALVEVDQLEREEARKALEKEGHETVVATNLLENPEAIDQVDCDVVLLGLDGIGSDGLRFISSLRAVAETRSLPLLAAVPQEASDQFAQALEFGASDCLVKPLENAELCARIRLQLRRKRYQALLNRRYDDGLRLAVLDDLTGLHNRRYLTHHLSHLLREAKERDMPVAAAMIDIDHFKRINDVNGHGVGDQLLRCIAQRLSSHVRPSDTLARLGGEEFVVVMPATSEDEAVEVAERLRLSVGEEPFDIDDLSGSEITISCGVALSGSDACESDALLVKADKALYQAKRNGRNQTVTATS